MEAQRKACRITQPPSSPPVSSFGFEPAIPSSRPRVPTAPVGIRGAEVPGGSCACCYRDSSRKGKDSGMTLKGKQSETLELHANPIQPHAEATSADHALNHDEVRRRAY